MTKIYLGTKFWYFLIMLIWCLPYFPAQAQNGVRIAATQGTADPSAMLDVISTSKGVLVPRMTLAEKNAISNPANGLLVYQTDGSVGFYYNSGTPSVPNWVQLSAGALSGTGTTNTVTKWTSAGAIGNSNITDNGTVVTVGGSTTTVSNLAGTGVRAVYADASGTLKRPVYYHCTGADQTYTVPTGVTSITVKMWGAGGGSGSKGGWVAGFYGGGGGFTTGTIAVTPGQTYYIVVGAGGGSGTVANLTASYGGGGRSCGGGTDCQYSGQGGGRSAFRNTANTADLMTAGGGGGGGCITGIAATNQCRGGAGGGTTGQGGECVQAASWAGGGGTQSAGGTAGNGGSCVGAAGTQYQGGAMTCGQSYGGGGGGGWYGGGSGSYASNSMGGGGGGSGYIGGAGVSGASMLTGSFQFVAGPSDPNYLPGIGMGGMGSNGGNGLVVIIPN